MITSIYDISNEFAGDLAAKLIAGSNDSEGNPDAYQVVLKLLQDSYEVSLSHYQTIHDIDLDAVLDKWVSRQPMPNGAIQSAYMQKCESFLVIDPKGGAFAAWLRYSPTDFETQTFDRTEV